MLQISTQPQSPFKIIGSSFQFFKQSFAKIWLWQLLFSLPPTITQFSPYDGMDQWPDSAKLCFAIAMAIGFFISFYGTCFIYHRMNNIATQADSRPSVSFKAAARRMWPALGGLIIIDIILGGLALLCIWGMTLGIVGAVLSWLILAVAVILSIFPLAFYIPEIVLEQTPVFKGLKRVYALVWGNWWRTFLVLFLGAIIPGIIIVAITLLATLLQQKEIIAIFAYWLALSVFAPFIFAVIITQFYDLKARNGLRLAGNQTV